MPRKMPEGEQPAPPLESILKSARELDGRKRLLTANDAGPTARDMNSLERQLTTGEAAKVLRMSASWLAKRRVHGDGPPFEKFGRAVRYRERDLLQYAKSRLRLSTSER